MYLVFFVFFKQKTAYELRISDWSSDVCSSDLGSDWDCTLEGGGYALRLGLRQVKGLAEADGRALIDARDPGKEGGKDAGYPDPLAIWRRAGLKPQALEALARADAYRSQGLARRAALWAVKRLPGE